MNEREQFDLLYGEGAYDYALHLIDALAPITREHEWWATLAPYKIICQSFREAKQ